MYKIYSKKGCRFCENTIKACKTFNFEYQSLKLDEDFSREEFFELVPSYHNTFPAIFKEGIFIGGFTEFSEVCFLDNN